MAASFCKNPPFSDAGTSGAARVNCPSPPRTKFLVLVSQTAKHSVNEGGATYHSSISTQFTESFAFWENNTYSSVNLVEEW